MITIKNLHYQYGDRIVFDNENITINENELTVIYGESGSGKSTLFNLLSMELEFKGQYIYNNIDISTLTLQERQNLRKNTMMYIHQDEMFIKKYSLKDNAKIILEAKGQNLDEQILIELMEKVNISRTKLNKPISNLSNGERQRYAIIMAMMVETALYIFDEPTSSLDADNAKTVIELIKTMVSEDKMIIVSLHDQSLLRQGHIYHIENQKIEERQASYSKGIIKKDIKKNSFSKKFIIKESIRHLSSHYIFNSISIIVLAIIIGLSSVIATYSSQIVLTQTDLLNDVYDNELVVINQTSKNETTYDDYANLEITDNQLQMIKEVKNIEAVYPHVYLNKNMTYFDPQTRQTLLFDGNQSTMIEVTNINKVINTINYQDTLISKLNINPIYPHHKIQERCSSYNENIEKGFYISSYLAQQLNLGSDIEGKNIKMMMTVQIASEPAITNQYDNNMQLSEEVSKSRGMFSVLKEIELPIKGILKKTNFNFYTIDEPHLFLDYQYIQEIIDTTNQENLSWLNEYALSKQTSNELSKYYETMLLDTYWKPSAYIIKVNSIENIEQVKTDLQKISSNFNIRAMEVNGVASEDLVIQQKSMTTLISIVLVISSAVLSYMVGYFKKKNNKSYYSYLSKLGMFNKDLKLIQRFENLWCVMIVIPFTLLFSIIIKNIFGLPVVLNFDYIRVFCILMIVVYVLMYRKYKEVSPC